MSKSIGIYKIYPESFRTTVFTLEPFRMIGLIDVGFMFEDGMERVTLAYFRSSGTNSGKIRGLWYPIVGVKLEKGKFVEFTPYINFVLSKTTNNAKANKGWLAKSLFFFNVNKTGSMLRGFSGGKHYKSLLWIGESLRELYEHGEYKKLTDFEPAKYNVLVTSSEIYNGNKYTQKENFEKFVEEIFSNN